MKMVICTEVDEFIATLEKPARAKWIRHLGLLEHYGGSLGMPHARRITSVLSELRLRGRQEVRAFYTCDNDCIIILHAFVKKTQKIPEREIETAKKRLQWLT